ncbi:hypothetical protein M514_12462, partial [Trichuris suis]
MDSTGKASSSTESLEQKVLATIAQFPSGCSDEELRKQVAVNDVSEYVNAINSLLADQKVEILRLGNQIYYHSKTSSAAEDSDLYESVIYRMIEEAGNRGIWVRDLKANSKIPAPKFKKLLKSLESRKMVKCLNMAGALRKQVYMLYDLTPDESISGGIMDEQLDASYAEIISKRCLKFLKQKAQDQSARDEGMLAIDWEYVGSAELCDFVNELNISKVKLRNKVIERIMDMLVYESVLERTHSGEMKMYRIARPLFTPGGFSQSPCFFCPVFYDCTSDGLISPGTCSYFDQILD